MMRDRWMARFGERVCVGALALGGIAFVAGCGAASESGALRPTERATAQDDDSRAGALWVALRITLDPENEDDRFRLHAVTYDMDGQETSTDLGEFMGQVLEQPVIGPELIRVLIQNATGKRTIRLWHHDGVVEASEVSADGDEDIRVIERIEIPSGVSVQPHQTPVEQPR